MTELAKEEISALLFSSDKQNSAVALYALPGDPFFHICSYHLGDALDTDAYFVFAPFHRKTGYPLLRWPVQRKGKIHASELAQLTPPDVISTWNGIIPVPEITREKDFCDSVAQLVSEFHTGGLEKAMLSAVREFQLFPGFPVHRFLAGLREKYPNTFVSFVSNPVSGTWIGATPEILLTQEKSTFHTIALAGTKTRESNRAWTSKEIDEQAWVSRYLAETLQAMGQLEIYGPQDFETGNLLHLRTDIQLTANTPLNWEEIVSQIHPTPAVGGYPKLESLPSIFREEKHNRSYYAGYLGSVSPEQARLFVNLRCMQWVGNTAYIYTGAGITAGSDPRAEWEETGHKAELLQNMLRKLVSLT